ncbi:MAG TPA: LLM class flavin-dependent oxidoreductase [Acidimicrobiales bacterium]|nr:LLM class flavin-dependent oxidoreductase [Acidimicrobiales bacterium]
MKLTVSDFPGKGFGPNARQMVELARVAEAVGVHRFGVSDYPFRQDCTTLMTACLEATTTLEVESLVTTPYRHAPDLTACAFATMAELSGGRAILGIGKGGGAADTWVAPWGWDRPSPRAAVRDLVTVCRTMWAGGKPPLEGEVLRSSGRELSFSPGHPVPILIAARGRRMLALAAELADIVHIATPFLGRRYMAADVEHVLRAAEAAGRGPRSFEIDLTVALSVSADRDFARSTAKLIAAVGVLWMANAERREPSGELISRRAVATPEEFDVPRSTIEAISTEWNMWSGERLSDRVAALIDDGVLAQFTVAGAPGECRERLLEIAEALPDVTGLRFKLPPLTGEEAYPRLREMIEIVGSFDELRSLRRPA